MRSKCISLGHNPSSFRLTCNQTFRSFLSVFTYRSIGLLSTIVRSPNPITLYAEQWSSSGSTPPQVRCYELVYQLCKIITGEHPHALSAVHLTPFTTAALSRLNNIKAVFAPVGVSASIFTTRVFSDGNSVFSIICLSASTSTRVYI